MANHPWVDCLQAVFRLRARVALDLDLAPDPAASRPRGRLKARVEPAPARVPAPVPAPAPVEASRLRVVHPRARADRPVVAFRPKTADQSRSSSARYCSAFCLASRCRSVFRTSR